MKLLVTPRLLMRPFVESDLDDLAALFADPQVRHFFAQGPLSRDESKDRLQTMIDHCTTHGFGVLALIDRREKRLIGRCGIRYTTDDSDVELTYMLEARSWGRGYATEAAKEVVRYAFTTLRVPRIVAFIHPENLASQRVVEKLGMKHTGIRLHHGVEELKYELENTFTKTFAYTSKLSTFAYL